MLVEVVLAGRGERPGGNRLELVALIDKRSIDAAPSMITPRPRITSAVASTVIMDHAGADAPEHLGTSVDVFGVSFGASARATVDDWARMKATIPDHVSRASPMRRCR